MLCNLVNVTDCLHSTLAPLPLHFKTLTPKASSPHWFFCCNTHLPQLNMIGSLLYPPSFLSSTHCSALIISPPSAAYHNLIRIPQQPLQSLTTNLNSVKFGLHLNILVLQLIPRTSINFNNLQPTQAKQRLYPMIC